MDCAIPSVNYASFSKRLHETVSRNRIPIGGSIDVTSRCNLRCVHCYVRDSDRGMSGSGIKRILDDIAAAGCLWLLLTGGEPLLRPDFEELYLYAKNKGFLISLFTNATLVTPQKAQMLGEWRPFAIEITVYGATRETYEKVTGVDGSYDRFREGMELLYQQKLPLRLKSMLISINQGELEKMMEMARRIGAEFRYDANIHSHVDGSQAPCEYRLTPEEIIAMDRTDTRRIGALKQLVDYNKQFSGKGTTIYSCGAGLNSFHIDARGRLCPCMLARKETYDLLAGSFTEGWQEFMSKIRFRKVSEGYKCAGCKLYYLCGQCPGWGEIENGAAEQASDFLCRLAKLRAEAYGAEIFGESVEK